MALRGSTGSRSRCCLEQGDGWGMGETALRASQYSAAWTAPCQQDSPAWPAPRDDGASDMQGEIAEGEGVGIWGRPLGATAGGQSQPSSTCRAEFWLLACEDGACSCAPGQSVTAQQRNHARRSLPSLPRIPPRSAGWPVGDACCESRLHTRHRHPRTAAPEAAHSPAARREPTAPLGPLHAARHCARCTRTAVLPTTLDARPGTSARRRSPATAVPSPTAKLETLSRPPFARLAPARPAMGDKDPRRLAVRMLFV